MISCIYCIRLITSWTERTELWIISHQLSLLNFDQWISDIGCIHFITLWTERSDWWIISHELSLHFDLMISDICCIQSSIDVTMNWIYRRIDYFTSTATLKFHWSFCAIDSIPWITLFQGWTECKWYFRLFKLLFITLFMA